MDSPTKLSKITIKVDSGYTVPVEVHAFPGGEWQVRLGIPLLYGPPAKVGTITARLRSAADVMVLLLATDALRRLCDPNIAIDLVCPYLPYARQDRVCAPGEALSLRVMCDLINAQRYASVEIWDPHSDVAPALLERVKVKTAADILVPHRQAPWLDGDVTLIAPDLGAVRRVQAVAVALGRPMLSATKMRDPSTGEISGTRLDFVGGTRGPYLIVDDICDGGRTFIELAKVLRRVRDTKIWLYVTHGIFSAGFADLRGVLDGIICANPLGDIERDFVKQL